MGLLDTIETGSKIDSYRIEAPVAGAVWLPFFVPSIRATTASSR